LLAQIVSEDYFVHNYMEGKSLGPLRQDYGAGGCLSIPT
jgi:hypothetical protein